MTVIMRFTGRNGQICRPATTPEKSAVLFGVWTAAGPVFRRETDAPEARIGLDEAEGGIKFFGIRRCDQLDGAIGFLAGAHVQQRDGLALIERGAQFHESAMRVYTDGVSLFAERRFIGQFPVDDHANLKKQPLAASFVCGDFHYSEP